jgi:hypothetical protein
MRVLSDDDGELVDFLWCCLFAHMYMHVLNDEARELVDTHMNVCFVYLASAEMGTHRRAFDAP